MKCRRCGAVLLDTDTFCVKCGQKVGEPMYCPNCGEQLRDGERFCHKCGSPVEPVEEEEEIPLSQQKTVDIPFDQIEQGILMEAEQAIVKRPGAEKPERRDPEGYRRPGTEMAGDYRHQGEPSDSYRTSSSARVADSYAETDSYRERPVRDAAYYEDIGEERYESPARPPRRTPPPRRYEEDYEAYDDDDEEDEDSGDSKMKIITVVLGIVVVAIALAIGFILWQRNNPDRYNRTGEETEQGEGQGEDGEEDSDGEGGNAGDTQGRIQILSNVNVRTAPTTEGSEVLMVAKQGETYEYYELVDDAWYHIKLEDGTDGYVSKKYVEDLE